MTKALLFFFTLLIFESSHALKLTTYNTGLAHGYVPLASKRIAPILNSLKNHDSDVLCLQEVWEKNDRYLFHDELKETYPHWFFTKIKNTKTQSAPSCKVNNLFGKDKFVTCLLKNCSNLPSDESTSCLMNKCQHSLIKLKEDNKDCANALMAKVGQSPVKAILTLLNPLWAQGLFAYKGSDGLMVFSKFPIIKKEVVDFSKIATLNRRRALKITIEKDKKEHAILCTHLTANLEGEAPYTGKFKNWEEENKEQLAILLNDKGLLKETRPTYILGDLNCGFANPTVPLEDAMVKSCNQILNSDFFNPFYESPVGCTFCPDNNLLSPTASPIAIDHILTRNVMIREKKRVFDELIFIDDKPQNLSDHYGLQIETQE